jgi:hypothetical protein
MMKSLSWPALLAAGLVLGFSPQVIFAQQYGSVTGQFVLKGDAPQIAAVKIMGKDAEVCAAKELPEETLIVDEKTKGIANIVVYLKKAPKSIHPDLKASKEQQITFDQKDCRFTPHVLLVRTDQEVLVKSDDPVNHNTHTHPFRNQELNFLLKPKDREGVPVKYDQAESLPMPVNCDLHPHMKAYWVICDHPYMALTDKEGKFKIENLPEGEYEFTVWHERTGYIDRALKVAIDPDGTDELGQIAVPASKIKVE